MLARLAINMVCSRLAYLALRRRLRESERLSVTDMLTGLPNKRAFMQRLDDEMARANRYQRAVDLVDAVEREHP